MAAETPGKGPLFGVESCHLVSACKLLVEVACSPPGLVDGKWKKLFYAEPSAKLLRLRSDELWSCICKGCVRLSVVLGHGILLQQHAVLHSSIELRQSSVMSLHKLS